MNKDIAQDICNKSLCAIEHLSAILRLDGLTDDERFILKDKIGYFIGEIDWQIIHPLNKIYPDIGGLGAVESGP